MKQGQHFLPNHTEGKNMHTFVELDQPLSSVDEGNHAAPGLQPCLWAAAKEIDC